VIFLIIIKKNRNLLIAKLFLNFFEKIYYYLIFNFTFIRK